MANPVSQTTVFEFSESSDLNWRLRITGDLRMSEAVDLYQPILRRFRKLAVSDLTVDLSQVPRFDDYGALILMEIKHELEAKGGTFAIEDANGRIDKILAMVNFNSLGPCQAISRKRSENAILRLGDATIASAYNLKSMIAFVGSVALAFAAVIKRPKSLRTGDILTHMENTGVNAVPIVGLISFLLGLVIAFMSSLQLKQFGANIYVASLVALGMVSELGPIMTAIVVAGRSGSAYAAEIGTMKISEEIDALVTMGFDPAVFLAVPRVIAAVIVVPLLTLFADIFAVAGGLTVGVLILDLTAVTYLGKTIEALSLFEVLWGLSKSLVFAAIIAWVGCLRGFQAKGGADAVGNAATSSVVTSIFLIILFDSAFAIMRSYW